MLKPLLLSAALISAINSQSTANHVQQPVYQLTTSDKISKSGLPTAATTRKNPSLSALPIEPAAPKKHQTKGTGLGTSLFFLFATLFFLAGLSLFAVGFLQGLSTLLYLGLGFELGIFLLSLLLAVIALLADSWDMILMMMIAPTFLGLCLLLKGGLLLTLGLVLANGLWIMGALLLLLGLLLLGFVIRLFTDL